MTPYRFIISSHVISFVESLLTLNGYRYAPDWMTSRDDVLICFASVRAVSLILFDIAIERFSRGWGFKRVVEGKAEEEEAGKFVTLVTSSYQSIATTTFSFFFLKRLDFTGKVSLKVEKLDNHERER